MPSICPRLLLTIGNIPSLILRVFLLSFSTRGPGCVLGLAPESAVTHKASSSWSIDSRAAVVWLMPCFFNKVLLAYSYAHLHMDVFGCSRATVVRLSRVLIETGPHSPKY